MTIKAQIKLLTEQSIDLTLMGHTKSAQRLEAKIVALEAQL